MSNPPLASGLIPNKKRSFFNNNSLKIIHIIWSILAIAAFYLILNTTWDRMDKFTGISIWCCWMVLEIVLLNFWATKGFFLAVGESISMLISSAVVAALGALVIIPATMVVIQLDFNPIRIMTYIYLVVYTIYPKFEVVPPKP